MFEIGWTEMLVIAVVMIVVVGPKDLPKMLRTIGRMTAKARSMAGDFQRQFNEALKEAELDDVKKTVDELRGLNPTNEIRKQLNPFEKAAADVRAGLDSAMSPKPADPAQPAESAAHPAEPLKNGATVMPGVAGPEAMPEPPALAKAPETKGAAAPAAVASQPAPAAKSKTPAKAKAKAETRPVAKASPKAAKTAKASTEAAKPVEAAAPKKTAAKKTTKTGKVT